MEKSRQERRADFNRGNIIEAACELFKTKGMEQTTMDDIARKAAYSKSTIYVYFKSKEEIYFQIVLKGMRLLQEQIMCGIGRGEDSRTRFFAICQTLTEFQSCNPLYYSCILGTIDVREEEMEKYSVLREIYEIGEAIHADLVKLIERGIKAGELRADIQPLPTVYALWSNISGIVQMSAAKQIYFEEKLLLERKTFLEYSFEMIWKSITNIK